MIFWGVLGLIFIRIVYPKLSHLIEGIPNKKGVLISWILCLFLIFDSGLSCIAVSRWSQRNQGTPATNELRRKIDQ